MDYDLAVPSTSIENDRYYEISFVGLEENLTTMLYFINQIEGVEDGFIISLQCKF